VIIHVFDFDEDRISEEEHKQSKREAREGENVEEATEIPAMGGVVPLCVDLVEVVILFFCGRVVGQLILCYGGRRTESTV